MVTGSSRASISGILHRRTHPFRPATAPAPWTATVGQALRGLGAGLLHPARGAEAGPPGLDPADVPGSDVLGSGTVRVWGDANLLARRILSHDESEAARHLLLLFRDWPSKFEFRVLSSAPSTHVYTIVPNKDKRAKIIEHTSTRRTQKIHVRSFTTYYTHGEPSMPAPHAPPAYRHRAEATSSVLPKTKSDATLAPGSDAALATHDLKLGIWVMNWTGPLPVRR